MAKGARPALQRAAHKQRAGGSRLPAWGRGAAAIALAATGGQAEYGGGLPR